jgi:hypothetical protein
MTSNNTSEYKVVADKIVSPDEDIIFQIQGSLYINSIEENNKIATIADVGEGGGPTGAQGATGSQGAQGTTGTGVQGIQGTQGTTGTTGDAFGIYYLGNYNSSSGYLPNIAVVRGSDGQLYLAKASGQLGNPIDYLSNGQWEIWIPKGATGAQGVTGSQGATGSASTTGSWTVATGTNTYSFQVESGNTYSMWVTGNIPNGIVTWNATVSVTNGNVPAIGYQYAWNYTGGGSPILITAIPNQIRGTAGTISTDNTYAGTTSNRFDFTIANTSGTSQTIYYGYTKI